VVFWRISIYASLEGLGAEISGGRWHTAAAGKRVAYLAEHPAVSLLENLVNLRRDGTLYPDSFQLLKVVANKTMSSLDLTPEQAAQIDSQNVISTQSIGDAWLAERSSALLRIPSIPSPESWNYLLNPLHPDASSLKIEWAKRITYDRRLFQLSK
jgi:RES domain-containing protein